jgi:outer membrane protein OmpA-like peptidoglycan-associated protein
MLAAVSSSAHGQPRGTVELGVLGRYTKMADVLDVDNIAAAGGRIGLFVIPNLSLETEVTYGRGNVKNPTLPYDTYSDPLWNYRVLYNLPFGARNAVLLGGGYAYDSYGYARFGPFRAGGPSGLVGLRFAFLEHWSARAELHGHMGLSVDANAAAQRPAQDSYFNVGAQIGLSYTFQPFFRTREVVRVDTVRTVAPSPVPRNVPDTVYRDRIRVDTVRTAGPAITSTVLIGVVNFEFAKYDLTNDAKRILNDVAASLARPENRTIRIEVKGNTDAVGGEQGNMVLGENRARAVADFLAANGVEQGRMTVVSAGKSDPVASNATPEGRATNRRVVISIVR